jgi:hypothetical protein
VERAKELLTVDAHAWADLVLPLRWHDLGVGAGDLDTGVKAGLVVSLNNVTAHDLAGSYTAVVWALRSWEAVLGPAIWPAIEAEECVFLLQTEPVLFALMRLHDNSGIVAEVVRIWLSVGHPGLTHDEDIVAKSEWIWVVGDRAEIDIRVVAGSLTGRRAVEIPFWELLDVCDFLGDGLEETKLLANQTYNLHHRRQDRQRAGNTQPRKVAGKCVIKQGLWRGTKIRTKARGQIAIVCWKEADRQLASERCSSPMVAVLRKRAPVKHRKTGQSAEAR